MYGWRQDPWRFFCKREGPRDLGKCRRCSVSYVGWYNLVFVVVLRVGLDRCCCRHFDVCSGRHPGVVSKLRYVAVCLSSPVVWGAQIPMESMCRCVSSSPVLSDAVVSTCTAYSSPCRFSCPLRGPVAEVCSVKAPVSKPTGGFGKESVCVAGLPFVPVWS